MSDTNSQFNTDHIEEQEWQLKQMRERVHYDSPCDIPAFGVDINNERMHLDSALRSINAYRAGKLYDDDSKKKHLAKAALSLISLIDLLSEAKAGA